MLADIDQSKEAALASKQQRVRSETLTPAELESEKARARASDASARSSDWTVRRGQELLEFEKNRALADINQSNKAAGLSEANTKRIEANAPLEAELLKKQTAEYVTLEKDGENFTIKGKDAMEEIAKTRQRMIEVNKERERLKKEALKDDRSALEASTKAETTIKTKLLGGKTTIKDHRELSPDVEMFHATSKNPYLYILQQIPGAIAGSTPEYKQFDLPTVNGHKYTAQEVYKEADAMGMTVQEYMEKHFFPMLKQPVPWNTGDVSAIKPKVPAGGAPARTTD